MSTARASASAPFHRAGPIRPPACMFSRPSVLLYSVGADVLIRPLSGFCGVGGGFAAAAASFFLSDQKETKESPGVGVFRKDLRLTPWSFRSLPYPLCPCGTSPPDRGSRPPDPHFYGSVEGVPRHLRPARCPQEGCLTVITAVLPNEPGHLLLQDKMRLSSAAYIVVSKQAAYRKIFRM